MINVEIDGKAVQVPPGSTVMDAATQVGAYVPHFCYHKKLSIAANCRMCLVQVEKAPKPLPACATPVTEGMKVFTASDYAKKAQQSVMEFLLINHPLDCPICDQGGECQLQDLAVGYGKSESRYKEEKRVVFVKNIGPLISAEEMSRCIQCTRCVRFGQEVAGIMELGMGGRGEHSEILSFVGKSVDSELSGNMIDVCPVGALTSKPFRYSARTWELQRRKSVSPHDGLNANLQVQVKADKVMRVLPLENEAVNECWISDRDRFSYEGLYAEDRVTSPMVKVHGEWQQASWQDALTAAAEAIASNAKQNGNDVAILVGPHSTLEESYLAAQIAKAIGSGSIDHRLRVSDAALDKNGGTPWLGRKLTDFASVDRFLVIGSSLRQEQPLVASRIRQRLKKGATLAVVNPTDDDLLCPVAAKAIIPPSQMREALAAIVHSLAKRLGKTTSIANANVYPGSEEVAANLATGKNIAVVLGEMAVSHKEASQIEALAAAIAELVGGSVGRLSASGATTAAYVAGAMPSANGKTAHTALTNGSKAFVLIGCEPELDSVAGAQAVASLKAADKVVALTAFASSAMKDYADVILPIAPFTETSGTYISQDASVQSFTGVVRPLGETRPGWKVLRVLGDLLHADVGAFNSSDDVKKVALAAFSDASLGAKPAALTAGANSAHNENALERVADLPIYSADPIVRRARSLQLSAYGKQARVRMNAETAKRVGVAHGAPVRVEQGGAAVVATLAVDPTVATGTVRVPFATEVSAALGVATGDIKVSAV